MEKNYPLQGHLVAKVETLLRMGLVVVLRMISLTIYFVKLIGTNIKLKQVKHY